MSPKKKKLIFVDIDGTLTVAGNNTPPDSAVDAIHRAQNMGHKVFLCTGRNPDMLRPLLRYGFDGVVACSGGYVLLGEELIYDCPMTREQTELALEVFARNNVFRTIEASDASYGDRGLQDMIAGASEGNSELERWRKALAENLGIRPMEEYDGRPIYKVVLMCLSESQLTEPRRLLESEFEFCMQHVEAHADCLNGELVNRKFNKGSGVRRICEALSHPVEETIGFGDSMNDLAMMELVGTSVCMANGSPELKAMVDMVCPSVEEDGLAEAFSLLGLLE